MTTTFQFLRRTFCILALAIGLLPQIADGQAYCSLRDPNRIIQEIFPDATGFRSFLRKVTPKHAETLKSELPIDFDSREFTTHTLYAVHKNGRILGYVQSRTEEAEWGLAEIIWVLDAELKLSTFRFQRCRSRWKTKVEGDSLQTALRGRSAVELQQIRSSQGTADLIKETGLPVQSEKLVGAVIESGLKAVGLARVVWGEDIEGIQKSFDQSKRP